MDNHTTRIVSTAGGATQYPKYCRDFFAFVYNLPHSPSLAIPTSQVSITMAATKKLEERKPRAKGDTFFRTVFVPLFLMIVAPPAVQFVWVVCYHYEGNLVSTISDSPSNIWANFPTPSYNAMILGCTFLFIQLLLLLVIPGDIFTAIPTPMGNRPKYALNGVKCFFITHAALAAAAYKGWIRYGALYDEFGPLLAFLGKSALIATGMLYFRGIYFPTNSDSGITGYGIIWDLFQGTELHPEILGLSLKQLINCRFAMMGWSVAVIAFAAKQKELYGSVSSSMFISAFLQTVYIFKFFCWEGGYFNSVRTFSTPLGIHVLQTNDETNFSNAC